MKQLQIWSNFFFQIKLLVQTAFANYFYFLNTTCPCPVVGDQPVQSNVIENCQQLSSNAIYLTLPEAIWSCKKLTILRNYLVMRETRHFLAYYLALL